MPILGVIASSGVSHHLPSPPVSGYSGWLDAADTATITKTGSAVTSWSNKGSLGNTFSQATAAYQPVSGTTTQNSYNVIVYGANDGLVYSGSASDWNFLHNASGSTIFLAFSNSTGVQGYFVSNNAGTSGQIGTYWCQEATYQMSNVTTKGTPGSYVINNTTASNVITSAFTYVTLIGDPANATAANRSDYRIKQGSAIKNNTQTAAYTTSGASNPLVIGDVAAGSNLSFLGNMGEVLIYNSILSAGNILSTQQYLAAKWGV